LDLRGLACWTQPGKFDAAKGNSFERHVYFLGNPIVYWFAALCLCLWVYAASTPRRPKLPIAHFGWKSSMLLLGYFSGLMPYMAVRRSCFNYHYMPPLHFLTVLCGIVIDHLVFRYFSNYRIKLVVTVVLLSAFAWAFWFWSMYSYGTPVTKKQYEARIWKEGWR
jgi:dolichyl-phosphate-mannose--protein O-mannosyl transferase